MPKPSLTILVIDDEQTVHDLFCKYLKSDLGVDYTMLHAYSGEEGMDLYRKHAVDCILLDNNLPGMSGMDLLQQITSDEASVPVVMITGEGDEALAVTAMKLGSQDYIPKRAINSQALQRTIARAAERAHLLHQMENYRKELERSNRELEQFATVVAHDLKAPLRAITQHLMLIKQNNAHLLDADSKTSMDFAVDGATRMRSLIDSLFSYSKYGFITPIFAPVNGETILAAVEANLAAEIKESNAVITHDPLPFVLGDSTQIIQLLQNLIANAIKFCAGAPHIHVSAEENGNWQSFSVRDNGIGIAPEHQQRIFVIFQRLHPPHEYEGTGVGLAICERIIKNHKGKIWVSSTPGEGATFSFTLPAALPDVQKEALRA